MTTPFWPCGWGKERAGFQASPPIKSEWQVQIEIHSRKRELERELHFQMHSTISSPDGAMMSSETLIKCGQLADVTLNILKQGASVVLTLYSFSSFLNVTGFCCLGLIIAIVAIKSATAGDSHAVHLYKLSTVSHLKAECFSFVPGKDLHFALVIT